MWFGGRGKWQDAAPDPPDPREYLDPWKLEGLAECQDDLRMPIRHDLAFDADPNGLIAQAEQRFLDRQHAMNASLMAN